MVSFILEGLASGAVAVAAGAGAVVWAEAVCERAGDKQYGSEANCGAKH